MKKKLMSLILIIVMAAFLVCGCGEPVTVESYYSQPDVAAAIDEAMAGVLEKQSEYLSDCDWSVAGNSIVYKYTYREGIEADGEQIRTEQKKNEAAIVSGIKDECGVEEPITVEYIYYAADGSVVADVVFGE